MMRKGVVEKELKLSEVLIQRTGDMRNVAY
jgi:hypothetical protein